MNLRKLKVTLFTVLAFVVLAEAFFIFSKINIEEELPFDDMSISEITQDEKTLIAALAQIGVREIMGKLLLETDGSSLLDCHQEAHYIGQTAYKVYQEQAFQECDSSCHSGCYHGAMEGILIEKGTLDVLGNLETVCRSFDRAFGVFECYHGLGHAVLAYLNYDLPGALEECKKLSNTFGFEITACYGGAFMENIVTGQGQGVAKSPHATIWLDTADFHFPCNTVEQEYYIQHECYMMQTSWMLHINGSDFDEVVKECYNAPEEMISVCFQSLGRDIAGHTLRDPEEIIDLCAKVPKDNDYYEDCIDGALNVIIDFWGSGLKEQASGLCRLVEEPHKKICYSILANALPFLFLTWKEAEPVCQSFEKQYRSFCLPS